MEFFLRLIQFLIKIINLVVSFVLKLRYLKKNELNIPPIKNKLLTLHLVELQKRLRLCQIKSKDLVQAYIDRIKEVNPHLNAVIVDRFEAALQEADRADALYYKSRENQKYAHTLHAKYPLLGIPFTVKEACGVKDMPHTCGSLERKFDISLDSCVPVKNVCSAGGILLLISANPEYCFSIETNTLTNGRCVNPYDFQRTCGGSSGGEGALHGSGASVFGIGSDMAGSIRIPCLFNGIFGHKPTGGLISNLGHFPNSDDSNCLKILQMGPMTRFGKDLVPLLEIMLGEDVHKLKLLTPIPTSEIKIFYAYGFHGLNGFLHQQVSFGIQNSIKQAVEYFEKLGLYSEHVKIKNFHNSLEIAMTGIVSLENFPYLMNKDNKPPTIKENLKELFKSISGFSKYTKEALIFELMRSSNAFMKADNMGKYKEEAQVLKQEIINLLGDNGVLFFPTFHAPAIHHNTSVCAQWGIDYCLIFNILGLPTTHVPMGLDENGLPIGFQVVAAPMCDRLCVQIAGELDHRFSGWVPPSKHDLNDNF